MTVQPRTHSARRHPHPSPQRGFRTFTQAFFAAALCFIFLDAAPALAQATGVAPAALSLSGPRFGLTYLSPGVHERAKREGLDIAPVITQFGWQFERRFEVGAGGLVTVSEWVLLAGGLEQGVVIPSVSWIVGLRTPGGSEFGVGPNLNPAGVALAVAGGVTRRAGNVNLPLNLAVVPSKSGVRVSFVAGFNTVR